VGLSFPWRRCKTTLREIREENFEQFNRKSSRSHIRADAYPPTDALIIESVKEEFSFQKIYFSLLKRNFLFGKIKRTRKRGETSLIVVYFFFIFF
jgi:hypothetical protein